MKYIRARSLSRYSISCTVIDTYLPEPILHVGPDVAGTALSLLQIDTYLAKEKITLCHFCLSVLYHTGKEHRT